LEGGAIVKKLGTMFFRNVRYIFLVCLIAFGLIAIVGSNGGGDGGGTTTTTTTDGTDGDTEGDTGDQADLTYTGSTSEAIIDSGNCLAFCVGAYDGGKTGSATRGSQAGTDSGENAGLPRILRLSQALGDSLRQIEILNKAGERFSKDVYTASDTLTGACGGSASYLISLDDQTGYFIGSFTYTDYCSGGVTLDGSADYSGQFNMTTSELTTFTFSFNNLTSTSEYESYTLDGDISWDVSASSYSLEMDMTMRDNTEQKVYKVEDYSMSLTEVGSEIEFEMSGKFYDPDDGYISVETTTTFVFGYTDYYPYQGVLVVTGAPGSAGGNTKARLTVISSTTFKVEADTNGDDTYDYDSGELNWSDV
jgi:hypothetical protein